MLLEHKIGLMLNLNEADHEHFQQSIRTMMSSLERGKEAEKTFPEAHGRTLTLARTIFKREWNRVKEPIEAT